VDLTIPAAVRRAAREFSDATAIAEPGGPLLSYRKLHERIQAVARALIASGIEPGDRIAIWSPNTGHWVLAALGTLYAGALARHPGVGESVVIGVPDARMGEVGRAYVLPRPGQEPQAEELITFCRTRLANYKVPRQIEFRAELPRNPAGEPLKRLLRQESP
jgi:acyl-CoA synthetase (AMP-forming)/AMP-acid ligase II